MGTATVNRASCWSGRSATGPFGTLYPVFRLFLIGPHQFRLGDDVPLHRGLQLGLGR